MITRMTSKSPHLRLRQGAIFLGGALAYLLLVAGPLSFSWTPFLLGAVYLLAALAGGRDGGFWATACVLLGWGAGVLVARKLDLEVSESAAAVAGAGAGVLAAGLLAQRGFDAGAVGAGATLLAAGLVYALQPHVDLVVEPGLWTILLGLVGAATGLLAVSPARGAGSAAGPR